MHPFELTSQESPAQSAMGIALASLHAGIVMRCGAMQCTPPHPSRLASRPPHRDHDHLLPLGGSHPPASWRRLRFHSRPPWSRGSRSLRKPVQIPTLHKTASAQSQITSHQITTHNAGFPRSIRCSGVPACLPAQREGERVSRPPKPPRISPDPWDDDLSTASPHGTACTGGAPSAPLPLFAMHASWVGVVMSRLMYLLGWDGTG